MLIAPSALLLGMPNPAMAGCAVTSGSGTVAIPTNGSTVTCAANGTSGAQIGDSTTDATVVLEDNHLLDRAGGAIGVFLSNATVTLGAGARIDANNYPVQAINNATITLGANAVLSGRYPIYTGNNTIVTLGTGAQLLGSIGGIYAFGSVTATLGINSKILSSNTRGIYAAGTSTITLASGALIQTNGVGGTTINNARNITLASGSSISAPGFFSTAISGSTGNDIIDTAGNISGALTAITFGNGDDTLILRTGASLSGLINGGNNTDTVQLFGTNSEDDNFTNFESLQMDGVDWTLSGTSIFGTADINSGILRNNGTMTSDVNVNAGTSFSGTGTTIGNIINDGFVKPGNSIGTQLITGNFTQNAGGELEIEFGPASSDVLAISGTATLDGTLRVTEFTGGVADGTIYTFLTAGGGLGGTTFSSVIMDPLFLTSIITYNANDVRVTLNRALIADSTSAGTTSESAVGAAIDAVLASDPASIAAIDTILNNAGLAQEASNILASQAGLVQSASVSAGLSAMGQSHSVIAGRLSAPPGSNLSGIRPAAGNAVNSEAKKSLGLSGLSAGDLARSDEGAFWAELTHSFGDVDGDNNARGADYRSNGALVGSEKYLESGAMVGLFGGFSVTKTELEDLQDSSTTKVTQAGLYAGQRFGRWHVSGSASGAHMGFKTTRPTVSGTAQAEFKGYGGFANAEAAYDIPISKDWALSPYMGVEGAALRHEGYRENGAGVLDLSIGSQTTKQLKSILGLGLRGDYSVQGRLNFSPTLRIGWAHEFADRAADTSASFTSAPLIAFQGGGPERSRDEARLHLDLMARSLESAGDYDLSAYAAYDGILASTHQNHALTAGLKFKW